VSKPQSDHRITHSGLYQVRGVEPTPCAAELRPLGSYLLGYLNGRGTIAYTWVWWCPKCRVVIEAEPKSVVAYPWASAVVPRPRRKR
jgi:hypothetical protein